MIQGFIGLMLVIVCGTDSVDQFHLTVFESPKNLDISKKTKIILE